MELPHGKPMDIPATWQYVRLLGKGATGTVIACTDEKGAPVALKRSDAIGSNVRHAERLLREVQLMRRMQYKYLVPLLGLWTSGRDVFLVMPQMETDLERFLRQWQKVPSRILVSRMSAKLLLGCRFLHAAGVLHRDLKPANILISRETIIKIADFGLSRGEEEGAAMREQRPRRSQVRLVTPEEPTAIVERTRWR